MIIEPWLAYSFGNAICSTGYSLSVKKGDEYTNHLQLTSYFLLISAIITFIFVILKTKKIIVSKWLILNGFFLGFALIFLNKSISEAKNPGLSMGIFRTQAVLTYIMSIFLFHSSVSKIKFFGIITVIIGAFIIANYEPNENNTKERKNKKWILYGIIGAVFISLQDIATKITISREKIDMSIYVFVSLASASFVSFVYQLIKTKNIRLESKQKNTIYKKD